MPLSVIVHNLSFLGEPWFAIPWYTAGICGALWVIYDASTANSALNPPLKAAWPIIIFFFSVLGVLLYLVTSRPIDISQSSSNHEKMERFTQYSRPTWRKVVASAIHCVGGDGIGIMTAMVLARELHFTFWLEFWSEYLVGYLVGWFIFQTWAMRMQGFGWLMSIWRGGRAEFFSMITVMGGMGLVMRFVTPSVVGPQPLPDTYAFWTFGALGLIIGFILTYPMNWLLVVIGWKHGQGHEHKLMKEKKQEWEAGSHPQRIAAE